MYRVLGQSRGRDLLFVLSQLVGVLHSELLELSLLQVEHGLVQATLIHGAKVSPRGVHQLQALVEEILNDNFLLVTSSLYQDSLSVTRMADMAATMAGVPKPWLIMEKWVKCLWMAGSMMGVGLVLQRGDRSWLRKSTSSLQMNLKYPCRDCSQG